TEALVSVDVNSARSTRGSDIEETATRTNLEAADEIARQLRLRDMAGLVVIDFIDMENHSNTRKVEKAMKNALANDRARIQVGRISSFGLMEMSRQRLRTGVLEASSHTCPVCEGAGIVRTVSSAALGALRALEAEMVKGKCCEFTLRAGEEVAIYVLNKKRVGLAELEERYGVTIEVMPDPEMPSPHFAIEATGGAPSKPVPTSAPLPAPVAAEDDEVEEVEEDEEIVDGEDDVEAREPREPREPREAREAREPREARGEEDRNGRRRRRRRRRGGRREDGDTPASEAGEPVEGDAEADDAVETVETGEAPAVEASADSEGEERRRRRRGRRGGRRRGAADGEAVATEAGADEAGIEPVADIVVDTPAVEIPVVEAEAPKPRRRGRKVKDAEAPDADADTAAEAPVEVAPAAAPVDVPAAEADAPKPKAKRPSRSRKAATETVAAETQTAEPVVDVAATVANDVEPTAAAPEPALAGTPAAERPRGNRKGWWQRTFGN
ncbi:MAG: ribonuclease E/G, partial [Sphingomonadaceae bacterium]|nr:ribonuclease E/G [Sphingomonadaceae bacterium]